MFTLKKLFRTFTHCFKTTPLSHRALFFSGALITSFSSISLLTKSIKQEESGETLIISEIEELLDKNLKDFQLIWYEMNGNQTIDSQIIASLKQFVEQRKNLISSKFKIVVIKSSGNLQERSKQEVGLAIFKNSDHKIIPLAKYLSFNNSNNQRGLKYKDLYDKLTLEIDQVLSAGASNLRQLEKTLSVSEYTMLMIGDDSQKYIKKFKSFLNSKNCFASGTCRYLLTDHVSQNYFGLSGKEKGKVYVLVRQSSNIIQPSKDLISIDGSKYYIYESESIANKLIFPPFIEKSSPDSFYLKISIDPNQNIAEYTNRLQKQLQKIAQNSNHPLNSIPKLIYKENKETVLMEVTLQKNNYDQIINVYDPKCKYSDTQKKHLISNNHKWKYKGEINSEKMGIWAEQVFSGKQEEYYESQRQIVSENGQSITFNSEDITGEEYFDVIKKSIKKPVVVFHYAENCFSCKKFKNIYEKIAGEKNKDLSFYRINNNHNKSQDMKNFHSTPVFLMYKNMYQFVYRNKYFTDKIFNDFIEITGQLNLISSSKFENHIKEHTQNKKLISQL